MTLDLGPVRRFQVQCGSSFPTRACDSEVSASQTRVHVEVPSTDTLKQIRLLLR